MYSPGEDHRTSKLCTSVRRAGTAPGPGSYVRMLRQTFRCILPQSWHNLGTILVLHSENGCIAPSWNEVWLRGVLKLLFSEFIVRILCVSQHACKTLQTNVTMCGCCFSLSSIVTATAHPSLACRLYLKVFPAVETAENIFFGNCFFAKNSPVTTWHTVYTCVT